MIDDDGGELFALVDRDGRPVGSATRAACHADPSLVHASVHVIVVTSEGVLWQLRGPRKDSEPSAWDHSCSGHVDAGEEPLAAAVRELTEEIGVIAAPDDLEPLGRELCELAGETELTWLYRLRHDGPFRFGLPELGGLIVLPRAIRPAPLSASAALLCERLDAARPGWDAV